MTRKLAACFHQATQREIFFELALQDTPPTAGCPFVGEGVTELVHIGQGFRWLDQTFVNTVFNYPTLAECHKVAA